MRFAFIAKHRSIWPAARDDYMGIERLSEETVEPCTRNALSAPLRVYRTTYKIKIPGVLPLNREELC